MKLELEHGVLDLGRRVFSTGSGEVGLTTTEARLLAHLAASPERAFGRDDLQVEVWGYRAGIPSRTVFTTVGRIRQKIEPDPAHPRYLMSVDGGYRFAQPRSTARPRAALVEAAASFVGRTRELEDLARALDEGARVLSILGPGGIGKTRLAAELVRRVGSRYASAPALVELEGVESAQAVARRITSGLELRPLAPGEDPAAGVVERLRDREQLVVCDNVEGIPGAPILFAQLAGGCPRLRLVVTTRVRLALACETAYALSPMATPLDGDALDRSEAGQLALLQARRVRPGWDPTPRERQHLARLCTLAEGSPLAIELAVAWLRLLEPDEVVRELERGTDLLRSEDPDVPARHTSIRATMDASFRLLAPDSVRALGAAALLREPFDREAALAVAGAGLRELGQLVDASMLRRAGGGRFTFHPAVRHEALARLPGDERSTREARHAEFFLGRLVRAYAALDRGETRERAWLDALGQDHADLVAAFAHASRPSEAARLAEAAEPFYRYLDGRNRFVELAEAWARAKQVLRAAPRTEDRDRALGLVMALEAGAGWAAREDASGLELLEPFGGEVLVTGLIGASITAQLAGRVDEGGDFGRRALELARAQSRVWQLGFALAVCGSAAARRGAPAEALGLLEEAVALSALRGGRAHCRPLVHLGEVQLMTGDATAAGTTLARALAACREVDDRAFGLLAASRLAEAEAHLGRDPRPLWVEAIEEGCEHHVPLFWWRAALVGLAAAAVEDAEWAGPAVSALACARPRVAGPERARLERALARGGEVLGPEAFAGWLRAGEGLDIEAAALALIAT